MEPNATGQIAVSAASSFPIISRCMCCNSGSVTIHENGNVTKIYEDQAINRVWKAADRRLHEELEPCHADFQSSRIQAKLKKDGLTEKRIRKIERRFKRLNVKSPLEVLK